jgi:hypothetical protein
MLPEMAAFTDTYGTFMLVPDIMVKVAHGSPFG